MEEGEDEITPLCQLKPPASISESSAWEVREGSLRIVPAESEANPFISRLRIQESGGRAAVEKAMMAHKGGPLKVTYWAVTAGGGTALDKERARIIQVFSNSDLNTT